MNLLGLLITIVLIASVITWDTSPELRCEAAQRQMQAYDMCRIMDECNIDQGAIAWNLYWQKIANEDCEVEE